MPKTVRTGRHDELVELAPHRCPNGHDLGPRQVIIGYGSHPSGQGTARCWQCRTCDAVIWDEPDPIR